MLARRQGWVTYGSKPTIERVQTILVVDDEPAIRRLAARTLEAPGYKVVTAEDGGEALLHVDDNGRVAGPVTDIQMARMDGILLAANLRQRVPALPIVFISGFAVPDRNISPFLEAVHTRGPPGRCQATPACLTGETNRRLPRTVAGIDEILAIPGRNTALECDGGSLSLGSLD